MRIWPDPACRCRFAPAFLGTLPCLLVKWPLPERIAITRCWLRWRSDRDAAGQRILLQHQAKAAVEVLSLNRINGNQTYLVLCDAYRAYIRDLRVGGKDNRAALCERLRILEPRRGGR